jgi:hypothetical protein
MSNDKERAEGVPALRIVGYRRFAPEDSFDVRDWKHTHDLPGGGLAEGITAASKTQAAIVKGIAAAVHEHWKDGDPRLILCSHPSALMPRGRRLVHLLVPITWPDGWPLLAEMFMKLVLVGEHGEFACIWQRPTSVPVGVATPSRHSRFYPDTGRCQLPAEWFTPGGDYPHPGDRLGEAVAYRINGLELDGVRANPEQIWNLVLEFAKESMTRGAKRISDSMARLQDSAFEGLAREHADIESASKAITGSAASVLDARKIRGQISMKVLDGFPRAELEELNNASTSSLQTAQMMIDTAVDSALAGLDVVSNAVQAKVLETQASQASREAVIQRIVTFVGAFILLPGLIASIYGANVTVPAQRSTTGLFVLLLAMGASGCFSMWVLRALDATLERVGWVDETSQRALLGLGVVLAAAAAVLAATA